MSSSSTKMKHPDIFISELEGHGRTLPKITAAPPTPAEIEEIGRKFNISRELLLNWKPILKNVHIRNIDLPGDRTCILCSLKSTANMLPHSLKDAPPHPKKPKTGKKWKPPYKIAQAGEKGLGVFATRAIERGSPILCEYPTIVIPSMPPQPLVNQIPHIIQTRMDPDQLKIFMTLSNSKRPGECPSEVGILRTNNIGIDLPIPKKEQKLWSEYAALFLETSRFNHSCGANASYDFNVESFQLLVKATHRILPGEEITIGYATAYEPRDARRARLQSMYRFLCNCPYCDLPDEAAVAESDRRREMIAKESVYFPDFEDWFPRYLAGRTKDADINDIHDFIARHKQGNEFREKEGLDSTTNHNFQLLSAYAALGDTSNFTKYVKKTAVGFREPGEPGGVRLTDRMLANPQAVTHWDYLKKIQGPSIGGK